MQIFRRVRSIDPFVVALPALLTFCVLWKGGKSLESTWLLTAAAWFVTLYVWRRDHGQGYRTAVPLLAWVPLMAFMLWTLISLLTSSTPNYGLDEFLRDGSLALVFTACARRSSDAAGARDVSRFLTVLTAAAAVAVLIGIAVYVLQPVNRFVGTFFDHRFHTDYWPNAWAQFLLLSWPAAAWWASHGRDVRAKRLRMAVVALLLGALLLSYSRGATIAFAGQMILGGGILVLRRMNGKTWLPWIAAIACASVAMFLIVNQLRGRVYAVQSVTEKVTFTADEGGSSVSERRQFWDQAILMTKERPLLGWGPYSFRFVQPKFQHAVLATSDHPHNVLLKLSAERGIPAAVFFVLFLIAVGVAVTSWLRRADPGTLMAGVVLLTATAGVLAHNLIDYNLQFVGIALPWWMGLGFLYGMVMGDSRLQKSKVLITKCVRCTEVALAIAVVVIAIIETPPMILSSLGRHAEAAQKNEEALAWYDAAKRQWLSRDLLLSRTQILFRLQRFPEADLAIDAFQIRNGEDPRGWSMKSDIAEALGDDDTARVTTQEAYRRNKWNDVGLLARLLRLRQHAHEDMSAERAEYETLLRAFAKAIDNNLHFIALGPNPESFQEAAKAMMEIYPEGAPEYQVLAAKVSRKAKEEREKLSARPPAGLW